MPFTLVHIFFEQWRKSIVEAGELKRQNVISQYESLKNQVNPHFLFNSMNTMIGLIDENPTLAKEYGHQFAEIYRHILVKGNEEIISLEEELKIVDIQRKLFKSRFEDGLIYNLEIPSEYLSKKIPPLTLQMVIENAVKHNAISLKKPLRIDVVAKENKLIVTNNIIRKNIETESTQVGIENILKRYKYLTSREVVIKEDLDSFTVVLPLLDKKEK